MISDARDAGAPGPQASSPPRRFAAAIAVVGIAALAIGYSVGQQADSGADRFAAETSQAEIRVAPAERIGRDLLRTLALTPDGREIIFVGYEGDQRQLYSRRLDALVATPIAGTEGAAGPAISPDGQTILFWADGELRTVPLRGGAPEVVLDLTADGPDRSPVSWTLGGGMGNATNVAFGAAWETDDSIIYSRTSGRLWRKSVTTTTPPEPVTELEEGERRHLTPEALPNSGGILFTVSEDVFVLRSRIMVLTPDGNRELVVEDASDPRYIDPGVLLYAQRGELLAAPFDIETHQVGEAVRILPEVAHVMGTGVGLAASGIAHFIASANTLAYLPGGIAQGCVQRELYWQTAGEAIDPITGPGSGTYFLASLSPSGTQILTNRDRGLAIVDVESGNPQRLGPGNFGIWGHDGSYVVHRNESIDPSVLYRTDIDNPEPQELYRHPKGHALWVSSLSSDGRHLAYVEENPTTSRDIWILDTDTLTPVQLLDTAANETHPIISPDDAWVAFVRGEDDDRHIFVQRIDGSGRPFDVSQMRGTMPGWSPNGDAIYFKGRGGIWKVPFRIGPDGAPESATPANFSPNFDSYTEPVGWTNVHPDEEKLADYRCVEGPASATLDHIRMYQGWMRRFVEASATSGGLGDR